MGANVGHIFALPGSELKRIIAVSLATLLAGVVSVLVLLLTAKEVVTHKAHKVNKPM